MDFVKGLFTQQMRRMVLLKVLALVLKTKTKKNITDLPYFSDYNSLLSVSRTSQKCITKKDKHKSHWTISRIFWENIFDKI